MVDFITSLDGYASAEPSSWPNTTLVRGDAADAVQAMKNDGSGLLTTIGSLSLCRSLMSADLVTGSAL